MFRSRRSLWERINRHQFDREAVNISNPDCHEEPSSATSLTGTTDIITKVIFLQEEKLVVVASHDNRVRAYDVDTEGEPRATFDQHTDFVQDVVQLDFDLVASVGLDKRLLSWRPKSAQLVGQWTHNSRLVATAKSDDSRVIVGDNKGKVIVLSHDSGTAFQVHRRFRKSHSNWVREIVVHRDLIVTCSRDKTTKLWNTTSFALLATLCHSNWVTSVAVSDDFIVTLSSNASVRVYRNGDDYPLENTLRMNGPQFRWKTNLSLLNEDVIVMGDADGNLSFISLSAKSFLSRVPFSSAVHSFAVLCDGRIAIGASGAAKIISPPESIRAIVEQHAATSYQSLSPVESAISGNAGPSILDTPIIE